MPNVFSLYENRDPLDNASRMGRGVGSFLSSLGKTYDDYQAQKKADQSEASKRERVNAIIQEFNNPNSPEYEGMGQAQRYMKAARLLYQAGEPNMSARFEQEANRIRQEDTRLAGEKEIAAIKAKPTKETKTMEDELVDKTFSAYQTALGQLATTDQKANPKLVDSINAQIQKYRAQLMTSERGRTLLGELQSTEEPTTQTIDGKAVVQEEPQTLESEKARMDKEKSNLTSLIKSAKDVNPQDGVLDTITELQIALKAFADSFGLSPEDNEITSIQKIIDAKSKSVADKYGVSESKKIRDEERARNLEKEAATYTPIYGVYYRLKNNPNDISARNDATNMLLRKESGAAIGRDEVLNRLATVLSTQDYNQMVSDLGGLKGWVADATGNENLLLIQSMQKYLGRMNVKKMLDVLKDKIGDKSVFNYLEKNYNKGTNKQTPKNKDIKQASEEDFE